MRRLFRSLFLFRTISKGTSTVLPCVFAAMVLFVSCVPFVLIVLCVLIVLLFGLSSEWCRLRSAFVTTCLDMSCNETTLEDSVKRW